MDKRYKFLCYFIIIASIILIALYGINIENNPIINYICGICWTLVAAMKFCELMLDKYENKQ